jgi:putative hydrolase of the HAD superfamily
MTGKTWIFYLDDTLMPNHHDYSYAQLDFLEWIEEKLHSVKDLRSQAQIKFTKWIIDNIGHKAPDAQSILDLQVRMEGMARRRMNSEKGVLSSSFLCTYNSICKTIGITADQESYKELIEMGEIIGYVHSNWDAHSILTKQVEIDSAGAEAMGFGKERFPTSIGKTYSVVFRDIGLKVSDENLQQAYDIGMSVFDKKRYEQNGLLSGAEETLDFLISKGDRLVLITKGDLEIQEAKIDANRLGGWFGEDLYVVNKKSEWTMQRLIRGNLSEEDSESMYHVGNSIRSDLYPSLNAGIGCVYVPCETWAFERNHNGVPEHPKLFTFDTIDEIIGNYDSL